MAPNDEKKIYTGIGLDFETGGLDCRECACTQISLQAARFDTWQVMERYEAYVAPYCRQGAGLQKKKMLRTRHEQVREESSLMKYEQNALKYLSITMDVLRSRVQTFEKSPKRSSHLPHEIHSVTANNAGPCSSSRTPLSMSASCCR